MTSPHRTTSTAWGWGAFVLAAAFVYFALVAPPEPTSSPSTPAPTPHTAASSVPEPTVDVTPDLRLPTYAASPAESGDTVVPPPPVDGDLDADVDRDDDDHHHHREEHDKRRNNDHDDSRLGHHVWDWLT